MNGIKKILCPVEFTEEPNNRLIQWALEIAKTTGGELLLINVVAGYKEYSKIASYEHFLITINDIAKYNMADLLKSEQFNEISVTGKVVHGPVAQTILEVAKEEKVDLIVMGTHGRAGVEKFLFGSVAQKVVQHSEVPVLTLKP